MRSKSPAELFKILSVETRLEIIEMLKQGPLCVCEIADRLDVTQSAVSQHLRLLKAAGLVHSERRGYWIHYSLNPDELECCCREVERVCKCNCIVIVKKRKPKKA
jgi:ArsR family transcriptional regulator